MAGPPSANAFPQQTFYDEKTHPIPPYLEISCEPSSAAEGQEADAAAGGATQSVLKRVSSFSIMSRVSSHLPQVASSLSLTDGYNAGDVSSTQGGEHKDSRETGSHRNPSEGPHVAIHSPQIGMTRNFDNSETPPSWRLRDRMKTVGVGLVMALNVGTDPPDIIKPHPCAKLQCWMDPSSVTRQKAKEKIGERLEAQYARWQQQRAARPLKYRRALDPTVEDVRALCLWLRRQARHERILFHYNGHGVPRPTANGEIWVFDKNHTEYIPLSVTDLRQWMGKPTIVVLDCSSAGILIPVLTTPIQETPPSTPPHTPQAPPKPMDVETAASHWVKDTIVLCPTAEGGT